MKQSLVLFEPSTEELITMVNNLTIALEFAFKEAGSDYNFKDFVELEVYYNYNNILYCKKYINYDQ